MPHQPHREVRLLFPEPPHCLLGIVTRRERFQRCDFTVVFGGNDLGGLHRSSQRTSGKYRDLPNEGGKPGCGLPHLFLAISGKRPQSVVASLGLPSCAVPSRSMPDNQNLHLDSGLFRARGDRRRAGFERWLGTAVPFSVARLSTSGPSMGTNRKAGSLASRADSRAKAWKVV